VSNDLLRHASIPRNRGFIDLTIAISGTSTALAPFAGPFLYLELLFCPGSTHVSGFAPYPEHTAPLLKHFVHAGRVESHTSLLRRQVQHCIGGPSVIAFAISRNGRWKVCWQEEGAYQNSLWLGKVWLCNTSETHITASNLEPLKATTYAQDPNHRV
jgi:hypothetical protein